MFPRDYRLTFPEITERILMIALLVGIACVIQRISIEVYRVGLVTIISATLLQIAVGNLPRDASIKKSLLLILFYLGIVATIFFVGILLVPVLSQLGS